MSAALPTSSLLSVPTGLAPVDAAITTTTLSSSSWTAGEDAALLAALITLPTAITTSITPTASTTAPTSIRRSELEENRGGTAETNLVDELETEGVAAAAAGGAEQEERVQGASTPLRRVLLSAATRATSREGQYSAAASSASSSSTHGGWEKVRHVAGRAYELMETARSPSGTRPGRGPELGPGEAEKREGRGEGRGGRGTAPLFSRGVHELEDRWKRKWSVEGVTQNRESSTPSFFGW